MATRPKTQIGITDAALDVFSGVERRTAEDHYRWDGRRRGDARDPFVLIQYTLEGFGVFETDTIHRVPIGNAFLAVIPSKHVYYLPAAAPAWTFLWVMIRHPYVVDRLARLTRKAVPIVQTPPTGEMVTCLAEIFIATREGGDDRFKREARLFDLITAVERAAHVMRHSPTDREAMTLAVRAFVDRKPGRTDVQTLAAAFGMSRSNFSHRFRAVTGLTPASYLRELRLGRARDLLLGGDEPVKAVARRSGFADSTHLTKAFHARFGFTPSAMRRQMRSG